MARRADALERIQIEAVLLQALIVVGETARCDDNGFCLVFHQVTESVQRIHTVHGAVVGIAELKRAGVKVDAGAKLAQVFFHRLDITNVSRTVLPPMEGVNRAFDNAHGIIVDQPAQLAAASFHSPFEISGGTIDEILIEQAVGHPLRLAELFLHDDGAVNVDALLLLPLRPDAKRAFDALPVAAEGGLRLEQDDIVTVFRSLNCRGKTRHAAAENNDIGLDRFSNLAGVNHDAGAVDGLDLVHALGRGLGLGATRKPGAGKRSGADRPEREEASSSQSFVFHCFSLLPRVSC